MPNLGNTAIDGICCVLVLNSRLRLHEMVSYKIHNFSPLCRILSYKYLNSAKNYFLYSEWIHNGLNDEYRKGNNTRHLHLFFSVHFFPSIPIIVNLFASQTFKDMPNHKLGLPECGIRIRTKKCVQRRFEATIRFIGRTSIWKLARNACITVFLTSWTKNVVGFNTTQLS